MQPVIRMVGFDSTTIIFRTLHYSISSRVRKIIVVALFVIENGTPAAVGLSARSYVCASVGTAGRCEGRHVYASLVGMFYLGGRQYVYAYACMRVAFERSSVDLRVHTYVCYVSTVHTLQL